MTSSSLQSKRMKGRKPASQSGNSHLGKMQTIKRENYDENPQELVKTLSSSSRRSDWSKSIQEVEEEARSQTWEALKSINKLQADKKK